jgi:hypothetical protein
LPFVKVAVAIVDRFELAAVDGNARRREQSQLAAQLHETCADLAQSRAIVLAEVGDRLVVGHETPQEPEKLQITPCLPLEPPARLHAVEIAIDVELQENRRVEAGPPGCCGLDAVEPKAGKIERVDESAPSTKRFIRSPRRITRQS